MNTADQEALSSLSLAIEGLAEFANMLHDSASQIYFLLDAALAPKVLAVLRGKAIAHHESLFFGTGEAAAADVGPFLARPAAVDSMQRTIARVLRVVEVPFAVSIVASDLDFSSLRHRLTMRLSSVLPDEVAAMLRFYDGRVVGHIAAALSNTQQAQMFSVASAWWYFDGDLRWKNLPCRFSAMETLGSPVVFSTQQQNALIDACYPYSVIEHFAVTDADLLETMPARERYAFFRDALEAAKSYGIEGGPEAVLFCTLALLRGKAFYRSPEWAQRLEAVKAKRVSLRQTMKDFYATESE